MFERIMKMRKKTMNTVVAIIAVTVAITSIVYIMLELLFTSEHKGDFITNKEYHYGIQYDKRTI